MSTHHTVPIAPLTGLEQARLRWRDDAPEALEFDDVYFSREDGRRETEHVFIDNNLLPQRFAAWDQSRPFVIAETGFGSGLNLLCAWAAFERHAPASARLHFVSVERYPFSAADLARALGAWPEFADKARRLIEQWPQPLLGVHRLELDERCTLDLHFGEAEERLGQLDGRVDAWFLDGFAPSKNPRMWSEALFAAISRLSHPGACFATFTCAGVVKRGLAGVGFNCEKVPGFGRKREMLRGRLATALPDQRRVATPWYAAQGESARGLQRVAVVGAGIAGASVAHSLARRGHRVTLIDPLGVAHAASGNRQAALYVKLAVATNLQSRFYLAALLHLHRLLARLDPARSVWSDCGTLDLALTPTAAERQRRFLDTHSLPTSVVEGVDAARAGQLANTDLSHAMHALHYPQGGWLDPHALCQRLISHPHITLSLREVTALSRFDDGWRLALDDHGTLDVDQVVICCARNAKRFAQLAHLPLTPVRGQVSELEVGEHAPRLGCVVCAGGYAPPAYRGVQLFGASFKVNDSELAPREEETRSNLLEFSHALPALVASLEAQGVEPLSAGARVGIRTASPDKSPFVGAAPDLEQWLSAYAALSKDARRVPAVEGRRHPGLWVSTAHGSRGMVSAPLAAELIASRISGEPAPMELALVDHLDPGRRIIAGLIRSQG
ncbi:bifunctional tRNA (5-methylaminomethyl-2-thiouridine)(34)-methyltransferase MnmD/FAD-dependent 5-carboxymethylaminomethyl-2-thiouridine(34) oxidoreductase MnmC [Halotalea alkalilenta]|uniref:tRNA 5-methylaminomethyl-2-thiouridine biosynthesis bifunctional protein MnmC n=1 Tax=Halotalea alkalilenta TaxID=376489 RepID=A0A172YDR1_9GAMM|nr:bifunctional tRNA (5-methylaminomethyl-2-thiouridine)(34)-methyltransferase MnmD/FAD-dependent 5-carboxymethylaminomethyl-2-thiouridine(34) oxidoreductase MnmC [Halotalea alkalilenta]ANF57222.1 FAD-dependent cmnm(5)s(2)U34 oxidoreductase [Halotalea alkalilenta]